MLHERIAEEEGPSNPRKDYSHGTSAHAHEALRIHLRIEYMELWDCFQTFHTKSDTI